MVDPAPLAAADGAFDLALASRDEEGFGACTELYSHALAAELEAWQRMDGDEGRQAAVERIARCCGRRALSRLHLADGLTMVSVSLDEITEIAGPYLRQALADSAVGLEFSPGDATLHHAAGVANEQLGNFEAAATHYAQTRDGADSLERLQKLQVVVGLPGACGESDAKSGGEWTAFVGQLPWWVRTRAAIARPWQSLVVTGSLMETLGGSESPGVLTSSSEEDEDSSEEDDARDADEPSEKEPPGQLVGFSSSSSSSPPTPADVLNLLLDCFLGQQHKPKRVSIPMWMPAGTVSQSGLGRLVLLLSEVGVECRIGKRSPGCVRSLVERGMEAAKTGVDLGPWASVVSKPEGTIVSAKTAEAPALLAGACVSVDLVSAVFSAAAALFRAKPWEIFTGNDIFRIHLDSGARVFVALQGCTDDGDGGDPQPEDDSAESGSEGEADPQPSRDVWTRTGSLLGVCVASSSAQSCGCPHSQHCECGVDRRRHALRRETQRFMWYGSEQHAPCGDLDAQEEHNWEVEEGSASFPLPMNLVTEGFGRGIPSVQARPSASELQRFVVLMRALAGFTAQISDVVRAAAAGKPTPRAGTVIRIPVTHDSETTIAEIVWGSHAWAAGTWRKFDRGSATPDELERSDESDDSSDSDSEEEEVVPVPRTRQQQLQDQRRQEYANRGLRVAARKPFFVRADTKGGDDDSGSESSNDSSNDSSSDSSSSDSSSESSSDDEVEVASERAGATARVADPAAAPAGERAPPITVRPGGAGPGLSDLAAGFGLKREQQLPAVDSAETGPDSAVDGSREQQRQQARFQVQKLRAAAAVRESESESTAAETGGYTSSSSDDDAEGDQTMRSLLRKHDPASQRPHGSGGSAPKSARTPVPTLTTPRHSHGYGGSTAAAAAAGGGGGGAAAEGFFDGQGDGRVEPEIAESFRDAITVSPNGILSFAAVEDDSDDDDDDEGGGGGGDGFGMGMSQLD